MWYHPRGGTSRRHQAGKQAVGAAGEQQHARRGRDPRAPLPHRQDALQRAREQRCRQQGGHVTEGVGKQQRAAWAGWEGGLVGVTLAGSSTSTLWANLELAY